MKPKKIAELIRTAPQTPGIYLFKQDDGAVIYIGKAKQIKNRLQNYLIGYGSEWKATSILDSADFVEWQETPTELAALLLEAHMVQSYQPPFNILLKTGQPYLYFCITNEAVPRFELVRTKKKKGSYFGPFIDKGSARTAYMFLRETFQLFVCSRKVPGGCLAFHVGRCAGMCKSDFDYAGYSERIEFLKRALNSKPDEMQRYIAGEIAAANTQLRFERSVQLTRYAEAITRVYQSIATRFDRPNSLKRLAEKDVWVWLSPEYGEPFGTLFLFREQQGILRKERVMCVPLIEEDYREELRNYLFSFYRDTRPSPQVILSEAVLESEMLASFAQEWHQLPYAVVVNAPARLEHAELMAHAQIYARDEYARPEKLATQLRQFLNLARVPRRIDCFDISHKQGHAMVGACVRFTDGKPDPEGIRHFHIKTVPGNNDYASLQEVVQRRYKTQDDFPDLIVIDGGKGQLSAAFAVLQEMLTGTTVDLVSLAKREETVYSRQFPEGKVLSSKLRAQGSLVALRDYAHHRAISFHRSVSTKEFLDE
jgi:excinuclease ABC subunit C